MMVLHHDTEDGAILYVYLADDGDVIVVDGAGAHRIEISGDKLVFTSPIGAVNVSRRGVTFTLDRRSR
jgi:hypothetical protein